MKYRLLVLALIIIAAGVYIYTTRSGEFDVGKGPTLLYFREDT